jgi:hypothetical protein
VRGVPLLRCTSESKEALTFLRRRPRSREKRSAGSGPGRECDAAEPPRGAWLSCSYHGRFSPRPLPLTGVGSVTGGPESPADAIPTVQEVVPTGGIEEVVAPSSTGASPRQHSPVAAHDDDAPAIAEPLDTNLDTPPLPPSVVQRFRKKYSLGPTPGTGGLQRRRPPTSDPVARWHALQVMIRNVGLVTSDRRCA